MQALLFNFQDGDGEYMDSWEMCIAQVHISLMSDSGGYVEVLRRVPCDGVSCVPKVVEISQEELDNLVKGTIAPNRYADLQQLRREGI